MDEDGGGGEIAQARRSDEPAQSGTDGATSGGLGGQAAPGPPAWRGQAGRLSGTSDASPRPDTEKG